jgi:hypothetical protein
MAAGVPNERIGIVKWRNPSSVVSRVYGCVRCNLRWGVLRKMWLKNKMERVVTATWECLRKTCLEIKLARLGYVVEDSRRSANSEDW